MPFDRPLPHTVFLDPPVQCPPSRSMSANKRTAKFVAPRDEAKNDSDAYSSDDSNDDFNFYQSRFPLPTAAPKPARPAHQSAAPSSSQQSETWTEVHDARKEKYQRRRTAREAELAALQAEAEENARNEFSTLPRFVPYARDKNGKWLGGTSQHKAKPKQLGVIEEYIIPDVNDGKKQKKRRKDDILNNAAGGSKEWSSESDIVETVVSWIERQIGEEVMTVAQIGERIQARVGDSWNKRYKQRYGPLVDWLKTKEQLLVHGDRVTVRPSEDKQESSESRERRQQRERLEVAARAEAAAARAVSRAERSWLAFLLYVLALLAVMYGAYSVWSGRNMSDLARQLAEQLKAMEENVAALNHTTAHTT